MVAQISRTEHGAVLGWDRTARAQRDSDNEFDPGQLKSTLLCELSRQFDLHCQEGPDYDEAAATHCLLMRKLVLQVVTVQTILDPEQKVL